MLFPAWSKEENLIILSTNDRKTFDKIPYLFIFKGTFNKVKRKGNLRKGINLQ